MYAKADVSNQSHHHQFLNNKVMKANEAPERIYLQPLENNEIYNHWYSSKLTKEFIEYTRTDAFIEKTEEFIYSALNDGIMGTANIEDFMRLFKKYMKGE